MVVRDLLVRGMIAGLIAGVLSLCWATAFGEPQVGKAIGFESTLQHGSGQVEEPAVVSRGVQETVGLATAVIVIGLVFGGLFALAFALVYARYVHGSPRVTALFLAAAGFSVFAMVPFLKYPANPPSIGQADTIGRRTALYFGLILIGLLTAILAFGLRRRWMNRFSPWNATLLSLAAYAGVVGVAFAVLPGVNEVPAAFPATVLWRFRLASLGGQAVLWAAIGLIFGALAERSLLMRPSR